MVRRPTFWTSEVFLRRDGKLVKIDKPADADGFAAPRVAAPAAANRLEARPARPIRPVRSSRSDLEKFLAGCREFDTLFEPGERKSLESFTATRHFLLVTELDNVRSRVYVLNHRDGHWQREPLPGLPAIRRRRASTPSTPIYPTTTSCT